MSDAMKLAAYSLESLYPASAPPTRNLGAAIMLAAIADYRGRDEDAHKDAEEFLYPQTEAAQRHYEWAVALHDVVDATWLREKLDRSRALWDQERTSKQRRTGNGKRMGLGERRILYRRTRPAVTVAEPARTTSAARVDAAAASL